MKRIMVLGCSGSGKSTFSRRLHELTKIPVFHLDQLYWKPNWVESTEEEWRIAQKKAVEQDAWIMDGNYSGTWDIRIPRADTLIFLDKPTYISLFRVLKRSLTQLGKVRDDMPEGCPEKWSWEFYHYVLTFNLTRRKKLLKRIKQHENEKQVHIFSKKRDIEAFFTNLTTSKSRV